MRTGVTSLVRLIFLGIVVIFLWMSCQSNPEETLITNTNTHEPSVSELALLMRQMHVDAKQWRQQIIAGDSLGTAPDYFAQILIATPTESRTPSQQTFFASQVADYTGAGTALFDTSVTPLPEKYNILVTRCINCHKQLCPGPVKTIRKLYIPEN